MGQKDFLAGLDAQIHGALAAAGVADVATYHPRDVALPPMQGVRVYVDRDAEIIGEVGQVIGTRTEVDVIHQDGLQLTKGGALVIDGETLTLSARIGGDGSISRWAVANG